MEHPRTAQMSKINGDNYQLNKCTMCPYRSHVKSAFNRHLMKDHGIKLKGLETNLSSKIPVKTSPVKTCPRCGLGGFIRQNKLKRHLLACGQTKDICCQMCAFKCVLMQSMQRHLKDKHNLICKPVDEPDFDQALNGTPYTLERVVVLEDSSKNDSPTDILQIVPKKKEKSLIVQCVKESLQKKNFLGDIQSLGRGNVHLKQWNILYM